MGILNLAVEGILRRRKSSALVFLVLWITFSFAVVSLSLVGSISRTNAQFRLNTYGQWYFAIPSGMAEDEAWLQGQKWCEGMGTAGNFGTIRTETKEVGFGTLDETFTKIGRITLDSGRLPEQEDEIALEEDLLNALGYDNTLGQEVTVSIQVPYKDQTIRVERTYVLCGMIHEYSDLWLLNRNRNNRPVVSAVVTESAAESVLREARSCISNPPNRLLVKPIPQYFLEVEQDSRETARQALQSYLTDTRSGDFGDRQPCENAAAYPETEGKDYGTAYIYMIAGITFAAVACVFVMQLPLESHRFTILRSIGMGKRQLALLIAEETLLLSIPAILAGIPWGAGLTWLGLRLMLYSGSVPIQVAIPFNALGGVIVLWLAAVMVSRTALFLAAVQTPLTGRMQLQSGKNRLIRHLRGVLIGALLVVFSAAVIYTGMESLRPAYLMEYWKLCPSYTIWKDDLISSEEVNRILQIPGISGADGFGEMEICLSCPGEEEQTVWLYAIDEEGWQKSLDFQDCREDFHAGSRVLVCFPEDSEENYALPEGSVTLRVRDKAGNYLTETEAQACVRRIPENAMNRGLRGFWEPYTVFCSEAFLKQLLASLAPGQTWDKYTGGGAFGYDRVYVAADLNSDDLSTDMAITAFCSRNGIKLDNRRQEFQARTQENVQTLILLYASGGCISLVALLILFSALSLETEREKRGYGILRAIGMSPGQLRARVFGKAFARCAAAVPAGWALYIGYSAMGFLKDFTLPQAVFDVIVSMRNSGAEITGICALCFAVPFAISLITKDSLRKGEPVICAQSCR